MAYGVVRSALISLCLVVCLAWAEEDERRWNVPPELIPEEIVRTSDDRASEQQQQQLARSLLIPITANINLGDTSQSLGLQLGPQGLGLGQSTTFSQPSHNGNGPSASISQSSSFTAGFSGISGSSSQSFSYNGQGNSGSQSSGHSTASSASASFAQSSASSSSGQTVHRQPVQPTWTNISPNYELTGTSNDYRQSRMPTLRVDVRPQNPRPVTLQVSARPTNRRPQQKPRVVIHRPRLDVISVEERNNQQWSSSQGTGSSNLQITVDNFGTRRPVSLISPDNGNVRWPGI